MYVRMFVAVLYVSMCILCVIYILIQWDLSTTDTLGTKKQFVVQRFPLFKGYLIYTAIYLVPQKQSVIERFSLLGEFVK